MCDCVAVYVIHCVTLQASVGEGGLGRKARLNPEGLCQKGELGISVVAQQI